MAQIILEFDEKPLSVEGIKLDSENPKRVAVKMSNGEFYFASREKHFSPKGKPLFSDEDNIFDTENFKFNGHWIVKRVEFSDVAPESF